jgi:hypothetical protein
MVEEALDRDSVLIFGQRQTDFARTDEFAAARVRISGDARFISILRELRPTGDLFPPKPHLAVICKNGKNKLREAMPNA